MLFKFCRFILVFLTVLLFSSKAYSEFEKEIELTDAGKCEEALEENTKTSDENEKQFNPEKLFVAENTIKIFRLYSLNRRIHILKNNCKKNKEAFELAKKSLNLEKELYKVPLSEFQAALKYTEFERKKKLG